jgi:hypothetical protein
MKTIIVAHIDVDLKKYGYHDIKHTKAEARHVALEKAIKGVAKEKKIPVHESALKIMREVNLLMIYNKNKHVHLSELMKRDRNWISKHFIKE